MRAFLVAALSGIAHDVPVSTQCISKLVHSRVITSGVVVKLHNMTQMNKMSKTENVNVAVLRELKHRQLNEAMLKEFKLLQTLYWMSNGDTQLRDFMLRTCVVADSLANSEQPCSCVEGVSALPCGQQDFFSWRDAR